MRNMPKKNKILGGFAILREFTILKVNFLAIGLATKNANKKQ